MVKQGAQNDLILIVINPSKRNPSHSYVGCELYKCNMIFELLHITYILLRLRRLTSYTVCFIDALSESSNRLQ